jgi:two-component system response regulator (stage 0 sporulation protein A)
MSKLQNVNVLVCNKEIHRGMVWANIIEELGGMLCTTVANDGADIIQRMTKVPNVDVDVLILEHKLTDTKAEMLRQPTYSSIETIQTLKSVMGETCPIIIVVCSGGMPESNELEFEKAGAASFIYEPFELVTLVQKIRKLIRFRQLSFAPMQSVSGPGFANVPTRERASQILPALMNTSGIPSHIKGYHYLKSAVELAIDDESLMEESGQKLYVAVAKLHDTSATRVRRAIRHAIEIGSTRYLSFTIPGFEVPHTDADKDIAGVRLFVKMSKGLCVVTEFPKAQSTNPIVDMVTIYLKSIGLPEEHDGFAYLRTAIILSMDDDTMLSQITHKMYPSISKMFATTPSMVERGIRTLVTNMFTVDERPTNSEFISDIKSRFTPLAAALG